jgi:hypothetical protein
MTLRLPVALLALLVASGAGAVTETRSTVLGPGTVRGAFLSRGTSPRAGGRGEAFAAVVDDPSAVEWNPAGLGQLETFGAVASWDGAGQGLGLSHLAVAAPVGLGTVGAAVTAMTYGSFTSYNELGDRLGSEGFMDLGVTAAWGLEVGRLMGQPAWGGVSAEFVRDAAGATMAGFGAGALLPLGSVLRVGAAVQHLGTTSGGFSLPGRVRVGAAARLGETLSAGVEGAYGLQDKLATMALGLEWSPVRLIAVRAGYRQPFRSQRIDGLTGLTAGLGVRWRSLGVDYAFQPYGDLAVSHRVGLTWTGAHKVVPASAAAAPSVPTPAAAGAAPAAAPASATPH